MFIGKYIPKTGAEDELYKLYEVTYTRSTSRCSFRVKLGNQIKARYEDNGYSGEYAPAFSNKLHPCSVLIK
jgi:hypothetical protein